MSRAVKVLFTVCVALFAFAGAAGVAEAAEDTTQQTDGPYYYYNGYTGYGDDGEFILDQAFINGIANNNFTLNGYPIDMSEQAYLDHGDDAVVTNVYDQHIHVVGEGAVFADMPVNPGAVTEAEMLDVYGKPDHSNYGEQGDNTHYYQMENVQITFNVNDGYVTSVSVGGTHVTE
ncbi:MAG TPA: hypothetical protein H9891_00725 [Candidatus Salinicoccus stercoripullorum]|uniref:Immunodominant staphylococcal antigen B n=1 Tax=Candidatus Salinicoccus stercoripullorum TaxID=2838756 RepID=A0A9D1QEJ3_9STAP|nr:hypothetical protein [Candidatus Salinicoccus stercoripullorum]